MSDKIYSTVQESNFVITLVAPAIAGITSSVTPIAGVTASVTALLTARLPVGISAWDVALGILSG